MKRLIKKILRSASFENQPPVLVDIGASGSLPRPWRILAPHSVCVAFDADSRDFQAQDADQRGWKKLWLFNRLVTALTAGAVDFYLTASPHCSSSLEPDKEALRPWAFRQLFDVERVVSLPAIDLPTALAQAGLDRVDWFKCDSQGTDLRLFRALTVSVQRQVLAADFEPGIIDAYRGEDKLHQLMAYMDTLPLWVSGMTIKGSQRIGDRARDALPATYRRFPASFYRTSPGWCEISYLNTCEAMEMTERDLLLAIVFAMVQRQHGFVIDLANRGKERFGSALFDEVKSAIERRLDLGYLRIGTYVARSVLRRLL
jgi:hypothetical protein